MKYREKNNTVCATKIKRVPFTRRNDAVSEVVGTLLLVSIGVSLFTLLALVVFNIPNMIFSPQPPTVSILGMIDSDNNIVLEHAGGSSLPLDTRVILNVAEYQETITLGAYIVDNGGNNAWDIGERFKRDPNKGDLKTLQVSVLVLDATSNTVILNVVLNEGATEAFPYAATLDATSVTAHSAVLNMYYDFRTHEKGEGGMRQICFFYTRKDANWLNYFATPWINIGQKQGTYQYPLSGLEQDTIYLFRAAVRFNATQGNGSISLFNSSITKELWTYTYDVGRWRFDEASGLYALDTSRYLNHGVLIPADESLAPERIDSPDEVVSVRSLLFNGLNNHVQVTHRDSLNLTQNFTAEAWVRPVADSTSLQGNVESLDLTTFGVQQNYSGKTPDIIHINGTIYAIVSQGVDGYGYLVTINVSEEGIISKNATTCLLDNYTFESARSCFSPKILRVNGATNIYVIMYSGSEGDDFNEGMKAYGYLTTVEIQKNGRITRSVLASKKWCNYYCYQPDIIHVADQVYAIVYTSIRYYGTTIQGYDGNLSTIQIAANGISISNIENCSFKNRFGVLDAITREPDIIHIVGDKYMIAFRGKDGDDGFVRAVRISAVGGIETTSADYTVFDSNVGYFPRMMHIYGEVYAVFYGGNIQGMATVTGVLKTFTISHETGRKTNQPFINAVVIHESASFSQLDMILINNNTDQQNVTIALIYTGNYYSESYSYGGYGYLKTVNITWDGVISYVSTDPKHNFVFQDDDDFGAGCTKPRIINLSKNPGYYAIVYYRADDSSANNGVVKTVRIAANGTIFSEIIDYVDIGAADFHDSDIIYISGDVYAVVGRRGGYGGVGIKTLHIAANGRINKSFIDSFEISAPGFLENQFFDYMDGRSYIKIIKIQGSGNKYAVAFSHLCNGTVVVHTIQIDDTGLIGSNILGSFVFDERYFQEEFYNGWCGYNEHCSLDIIHIKNQVYAISFHGFVQSEQQHGHLLLTVSISANGGTITFLDLFNTTQFSSAPLSDYCPYGFDYFVIHEYTCLLPVDITQGTYALFYCWEKSAYSQFSGPMTQSPYGYGQVITVHIEENGMIEDTALGNFTFSFNGTSEPDILQITENIFLISFSRTYQFGAAGYMVSNRGFLMAIEISSDGQQFRMVDSGTTIAHCMYPTIISYKDSVYALAYTNAYGYPYLYSNGILGSFRVGLDGNISRAAAGMAFDYIMPLAASASCIRPRCLHITGDIYAMVYSTSESDGMIETIKITIPEGGTKTNILSKNNVITVKADATQVNATLTMSDGDHSLILKLYDSWNYLVLTYNYLNNTLSFYNLHGNHSEPTPGYHLDHIQKTVTGTILTSKSNLIFGPYKGLYDEFILSSLPMTGERVEQRYTTYLP